MKSRITIDMDNDCNPVIKIDCNLSSNDVRDKMLQKLVQLLTDDSFCFRGEEYFSKGLLKVISGGISAGENCDTVHHIEVAPDIIKVSDYSNNKFAQAEKEKQIAIDAVKKYTDALISQKPCGSDQTFSWTSTILDDIQVSYATTEAVNYTKYGFPDEPSALAILNKLDEKSRKKVIEYVIGKYSEIKNKDELIQSQTQYYTK